MKKIFSLCLLTALILNFASCLEPLPEKTKGELSSATVGTEMREPGKNTVTTPEKQTEEPPETTTQLSDTEPAAETTENRPIRPDIGLEYIVDGLKFYYEFTYTEDYYRCDYYPENLSGGVSWSLLQKYGYGNLEAIDLFLKKYGPEKDFYQLPVVYYYLKLSGISKEDFIRINNQNKSDDSILTDWQIDILFDETDVNVIKEKLKSYGAFYFDGRLYDPCEVVEIYENSGVETLRKWADEGDFLAYLDKMEEYFNYNPFRREPEMLEKFREIREAVLQNP